MAAHRESTKMQRVGILGGGQLGRMLSQAASPLGVEVAVLDPAGAQASAASPASAAHAGDFKNEDDIRAFVRDARPDVLTVEIEHVNVEALYKIEKEMSKRERRTTKRGKGGRVNNERLSDVGKRDER